MALIQNFEGYSPFIYKDAAGIPTIGFGHAIRPGETFKQPLLPPDAQMLLQRDLQTKEQAINRLVDVRLNPGQFDALADFTFNVGEGNLSRSTLLKKVNARLHAEVPPQFLRWDTAAGIKLKGLYLRRRAEASLYAASTQ